MHSNCSLGLGILVISIWSLVLGPSAVQAQVVGFGFTSPAVVRASMHATPTRLHTPGKGVLKIVCTVMPGYHLQSHHPLDKFLVPAEVVISPVKGFDFGKVVFPQAKLIAASALITSVGKLSVYEGRFVIAIPFTASNSARNGRNDIDATFSFQACNAQSCLPPQTLKLSTFVRIDGGKLQAGKPQQPMQSAGSGTSPTAAPRNQGNQRSNVNATLAAISKLHYDIKTVHEPVWRLILFALIGGMILNVMPCVLPVIPLKVLAMVQQAHGSRKMAVLHALVFSAGIISLFFMLAVLMGIYRAVTGQTLTYGMQYQHPAFLIAIGLILLALALSMLGVWTIQLPNAVYSVESSRGGLAGAFGMGLLATLLATPCSAPFLGVMLTWALVQPTAVIVLFFVLIGVGMAWPYVVLAAFPAWLNHVPRAGRWSEIVKEALGLVMVAVAVYLLLSTENRSQITVGFMLAILLAMVCWGWGRLPDINMKPVKIWSIRLGFVAGGVLAGGLYLVWTGGIPAAKAAAANSVSQKSGTFTVNHWQAFNWSAMNAALQSGHPVVVDFTAPWCINCRFVKATVLDARPVRQKFSQAAAVLFSADIDQRVAKAFWLKLGGRAIPYLAILSPKHPASPAILRDIYTQQEVMDDIAAAQR
jgi:thiol:disulfide interchange protein